MNKRERNIGLMKIAHIVSGIILFHLFFPYAASAQNRHPERFTCLPSDGVSLESLSFGEEQRAAVERLEKAYDDEINEVKGRLMSKRLELQALFGNPHADEKTIRAKAREVFDLQDECRRIGLNHQLEVRRILTPEQLRNWRPVGDWSSSSNRRK